MGQIDPVYVILGNVILAMAYHMWRSSEKTQNKQGDAQVEDSKTLAKLEGAYEERFTTIFNRLDGSDKKHDLHVEKMNEVCDRLSTLCGRFEALLNAGRSLALQTRQTAAG